MPKHATLSAAAAVFATSLALVPPALVSQSSADLNELFIADYLMTEGAASEEISSVSGAWFDSKAAVLWTVSDDSARPRMVIFDVAPGIPLQLELREVVPMSVVGQQRPLKMEGIAPADADAFFIVSEGELSDPAAPLAGIFRCTALGACVPAVDLPFYYQGTNSAEGLRGGAGLEGVSVSPSGTTLIAAVESSLKQDGPEATAESGPVVRLLTLDLRNSDATPREYAYRVDAPDNFPGRSGVVEVLALDDTRVLVAEYNGHLDEISGRPVGSTRYYNAQLDSRAEVTGKDMLDPRTQVTLEKELLLDLSRLKPRMQARLRSVISVGSLTFGPQLPSGERSLLLLNSFQEEPGMGIVLVRLSDLQ